jgi:hypothetical protein
MGVKTLHRALPVLTTKHQLFSIIRLRGSLCSRSRFATALQNISAMSHEPTITYHDRQLDLTFSGRAVWVNLP